jgi:hypothetical protein
VWWVLVRSGGFWCALVVLVRSGRFWNVLLSSGVFWWVLLGSVGFKWFLVGSGRIWWSLVSSGVFWCILLRSGTTERLALALGRFLRSWELAQSWAMVALEADQLPAAADRRRYLAALADLERTGRPAIAVGGYEAWLARNPQDNLALFGLANSQLAQGNPTAAEATYERLLKLRPGDPAASNNLARLLLDRGCAASARRVLAEMAELIPAGMADAVRTTRSDAAGGDDAACREGPSDGHEDVGDAHQFEH